MGNTTLKESTSSYHPTTQTAASTFSLGSASNRFLDALSNSSLFKASNGELNSMISSSKMDSEIYLCGCSSSLYYDGINPGFGVTRIIDDLGHDDGIHLSRDFESNGSVASKLILKHTIVYKVVSGRLHTHIITADGKIISFGSNNHGQLACGVIGGLKSSYGVVRAVGDISNHFIIDGAAGGYHSLFITAENKVFGAGSNSNRQLGVNTSDTVSVATAVEIPQESFDGKKVVACSAGDSHSCFLTSCGRIYFSGSNSNGSCAGTTGSKPTLLVNEMLHNEFPIQISCGYDNTMILCQSGNIYGVGCNSCGQLASDGEHANFGDIRRVYKGATDVIWIGSGYFCSAVCSKNECYYAPAKNNVYDKLSDIKPNAISVGVGDSIIFATNEINEKGNFGKLYTINSGDINDITGDFSMDSISSKIEFSGQRDVYIAYVSKIDPAFMISHHFLNLEKILDFVKGNTSQYSNSTVFSDIQIQIDA